MAKTQNNCLEVKEFELQSRYYVHFQTRTPSERHELI